LKLKQSLSAGSTGKQVILGGDRRGDRFKDDTSVGGNVERHGERRGVIGQFVGHIKTVKRAKQVYQSYYKLGDEGLLP